MFTELEIEQIAEKLRQKNEEVSEDDPPLCCIPYHVVVRLSDCKDKWDRCYSGRATSDGCYARDTHKSPYYRSSRRGENKVTKKPRYMNCARCVVWQMFEANEAAGDE